MTENKSATLAEVLDEPSPEFKRGEQYLIVQIGDRSKSYVNPWLPVLRVLRSTVKKVTKPRIWLSWNNAKEGSRLAPIMLDREKDGRLFLIHSRGESRPGYPVVAMPITSRNKARIADAREIVANVSSALENVTAAKFAAERAIAKRQKCLADISLDDIRAINLRSFRLVNDMRRLAGEPTVADVRDIYGEKQP